MTHVLAKSDAQRKAWAVSLCFASGVLMSLEALHPGACAWMGFSNEQSFMLSASFATVSIFLASFILTRMLQPVAVE